MVIKIELLKEIKRINDNMLLELKTIINTEIDRRQLNDTNNNMKNG